MVLSLRSSRQTGTPANKKSAAEIEYIENVLNPFLEPIVQSLLINKPENPAQHILEYLGASTSSSELIEKQSCITALQEQLKQESKLVRDLISERDSMSARCGSTYAEEILKNMPDVEIESSESDSESDFDDSVPLKLPLGRHLGARASVSAESYGEWNVKKKFTPPVFAKSAIQYEQIKTVLKSSLMFAHLEPEPLEVIINAISECKFTENQYLIKQGDDGDCLYILSEGNAEAWISQPDKTNIKVKSYTVGGVFGELALLYDVCRAASIIATSDVVALRLDRETFSSVIKDAVQYKLDLYDSFLRNVPILASCDSYQRSLIADALYSEVIPAGTAIVRQGEDGNRFYIIRDGNAFATVLQPDNTELLVKEYSTGDYFGELALLHNKSRAASVIAKTDCKVVSLDRKSFTRLLGSLQNILRNNISQYS